VVEGAVSDICLHWQPNADAKVDKIVSYLVSKFFVVDKDATVRQLQSLVTQSQFLALLHPKTDEIALLLARRRPDLLATVARVMADSVGGPQLTRTADRNVEQFVDLAVSEGIPLGGMQLQAVEDRLSLDFVVNTPGVFAECSLSKKADTVLALIAAGGLPRLASFGVDLDANNAALAETVAMRLPWSALLRGERGEFTDVGNALAVVPSAASAIARRALERKATISSQFAANSELTNLGKLVADTLGLLVAVQCVPRDELCDVSGVLRPLGVQAVEEIGLELVAPLLPPSCFFDGATGTFTAWGRRLYSPEGRDAVAPSIAAESLVRRALRDVPLLWLASAPTAHSPSHLTEIGSETIRSMLPASDERLALIASIPAEFFVVGSADAGAGSVRLSPLGEKLLDDETLRELISRESPLLFSSPSSVSIAGQACLRAAGEGVVERIIQRKAAFLATEDGTWTPLGEFLVDLGAVDGCLDAIAARPELLTPAVLHTIPEALDHYHGDLLNIARGLLSGPPDSHSDAALASLASKDDRVCRAVADSRGLAGVSGLLHSGVNVKPHMVISRWGSWGVYAALSLLSVASDVLFCVSLFQTWLTESDAAAGGTPEQEADRLAHKKVAGSLAIASLVGLVSAFTANVFVTRWFVSRAYSECVDIGCSQLAYELMWGESRLVTFVVIAACVASPEAGTLIYGSLSPPRAVALLKQWSWPAAVLEDALHLIIQIVAFSMGFTSNATAYEAASLYLSAVTTFTQIAFRATRSLVISVANSIAEGNGRISAHSRQAPAPLTKPLLREGSLDLEAAAANEDASVDAYTLAAEARRAHKMRRTSTLRVFLCMLAAAVSQVPALTLITLLGTESVRHLISPVFSMATAVIALLVVYFTVLVWRVVEYWRILHAFADQTWAIETIIEPELPGAIAMAAVLSDPDLVHVILHAPQTKPSKTRASTESHWVRALFHTIGLWACGAMVSFYVIGLDVYYSIQPHQDTPSSALARLAAVHFSAAMFGMIITMAVLEFRSLRAMKTLGAGAVRSALVLTSSLGIVLGTLVMIYSGGSNSLILSGACLVVFAVVRTGHVFFCGRLSDRCLERVLNWPLFAVANGLAITAAYFLFDGVFEDLDGFSLGIQILTVFTGGCLIAPDVLNYSSFSLWVLLCPSFRGRR
jgi:hypothetical protein